MNWPRHSVGTMPSQMLSRCGNPLLQSVRAARLARFRHQLVKTGGPLIEHARYYWLLLAESGLTQRLFGPWYAELLPSGR